VQLEYFCPGVCGEAAGEEGEEGKEGVVAAGEWLVGGD